jgi:hypothetical protein
MSSAPLMAIPPAIDVERRRTRRIDVSLPVEVEVRGETRPARLTDLSRAGGRIDDFAPPKSLGEPLTLRRNGVELNAQIVWADRSSAGLWFPEPMGETSFIRLRHRASD